jgi:hypothetical protein
MQRRHIPSKTLNFFPILPSLIGEKGGIYNTEFSVVLNIFIVLAKKDKEV